jgi:hypothetical protein
MKVKEVITEDGIVFDSNEEMYFYWWVKELKKEGYIDSIEMQPKAFELSDKTVVQHTKPMKKTADKVLDHTLVNEHVYTADALIKWNEKALGIFCYVFPPATAHEKQIYKLFVCDSLLYSYFEVKPIFDQNNMTRLVKINIKWVLKDFGILVNMFIPETVFNAYFTPQRYLFQNKAKGSRKIKYKNIIMLNEFLPIKNNQEKLTQTSLL